jgi:hypothetical protein
VVGLSNVLSNIEATLSEQELSDWQKTALLPILEGCHNVLIALDKVVVENYYLKTSNPDGLRDKSRRARKRLNWEPKDVQDLRSRVTLNVGLLNAFHGSLTRYLCAFIIRITSELTLLSKVALTAKDGVDRLHERQDHQESHKEHQAILDWLTPIDYATQQKDFASRRQEGTGQRLLNSDQFRDWVDQSGQTLFCPGIPGAGKTISASIVVDKLHEKYQNDASVGIAYIYCNFRRQQEQKPLNLLANLLKQLIQGLCPVPQSIQQLYEHHQHKRSHPSLDEISQALQSVVLDYSKAFIVIDALDECQVSDGDRKRFLAKIFNLQAKTAANLFVTSRFILEIEKEFEGRSTRLEIRASDDDLRRYLDEHILKLPSFVSRSAELQKKVKSTIINTVDGMYVSFMLP